ncbi:RNA 2'-phosphotransferase [Paenibacillus dokdonensis]|uniref:RNA 2'-phosphotransferase n=1 Tax=Paenibacillus dokdonensis TaxID=2567944 RepID=A0ABU6GPP3_9BACL|nr:RNA 2'-phosphotransferase [Paenibacillus dokdonensis]
MNHEGYCDIRDLINGIKSEKRWSAVSESDIKQVVDNCPKQRYEIINGYIRANYGHSSGR